MVDDGIGRRAIKGEAFNIAAKVLQGMQMEDPRVSTGMQVKDPGALECSVYGIPRHATLS